MNPSRIDHLEAVINGNKLVSFILGLDEYLNKRPDVDYQRWIALEQFYKSPGVAAETKQKIENTVIDLFRMDDASAKYASIAIGRVLRLSGTVEKIKEIIINSELGNYPRNLQVEILISAIKLQIPETAIPALEEFISRGKLIDFLSCSSVPPYISKVADDDIWRLDILRQVFTTSEPKQREAIARDVETTAKHSRNFCLAIKQYQRLCSEYNEFNRMLHKTLPFHKRFL